MTKFGEDRTKIVDFSLKVTFLASPENKHSPSSTYISLEPKDAHKTVNAMATNFLQFINNQCNSDWFRLDFDP